MLVETSLVDGVYRITLNRPQDHNALNTDLLNELSKILVKLDKDARIVVFEGNGLSFCSGADLKEILEMSSRDLKHYSILGKKICAQIEAIKVPTIAVLHGSTTGEGIELALCCDLRVASDKTILEFPQVKLGYPPGFGGTKKLPQVIGRARALEVLLTSASFDAKTAHLLGLVNQVVPHKSLEKSVDSLIALLMKHELYVNTSVKFLVHNNDLVKETSHFSEQAASPETKLRIKERLGER